MAAGVGLRSAHVTEVITTRPPAGWFEVHAENYLGGGRALAALERVRADYPVALHAVGLSLGSADHLSVEHLRRLRGLVDRLQPLLVSEHLAWSGTGGAYLNHLLPLPYTEETLAVVGHHVAETQAALGRQILVENPSSYLRFRHSTISESEFLAALVAETGCGLLCDLNNIHVSAANVGLDPIAYLDDLPGPAIAEFHLAGHAVNDADERRVLIDDHGSPVAPEVWALYAHAVARFGPRPTLIEWDTAIPPLPVLLAEARRADRTSRVAATEAPDAVTR
jgi:uncharacterized protein (UPF0276 family)